MIQVIEKHVTDTPRGVFRSELTKGKDPAGRDFIRHDESLFSGLCISYRMIMVVSSNLLEVSKYHHCQDDFEEEEEIKEKGLWAYVEADASRIMTVNNLKDFNEVFKNLEECIRKKDGWGKTVKCE